MRLSRQAPGYPDTGLYRDRNDQDRYVTIDRWGSERAIRGFRARFAEEFERLNSDGEDLTLEETPIIETDGITDAARASVPYGPV